MSLWVFPALLLGGLAYILTTIFTLIIRLPLKKVLLAGISSLGMFTGLAILVFSLLHFLAEKKLSVEEQLANKEEEKKESEDEFTPLNPPVLEIREKGRSE